MGTTFTIYLYADREERADECCVEAFEEIDRVEEALSNYRATSELSRINRLAYKESVTTDPEVFQLLQRSLEFSRRTGGAFDITVGPLMRAWGFFRGRGRYPDAAELKQARASTGWQNVKLDPKARTVRFLLPGMDLDPGGIGKGYAVDRAAAVLRDAGVKSALVDSGSSSMFAIGAPPGKTGWPVQIPKPGNRSQAISSIELRDVSLSTSGNYEKFFELDGRAYCHIMNPRTGEPVQGMLQTTVIAREATDTDALSTAMFVMGSTAGKQWLERVPGSSAFWVEGDAHTERITTLRWPNFIRSDG